MNINDILEKHRLWLKGKGGEKANLSNACLRNADLSNAYLSNAYLSNAYLRNADLSNANLSCADLSNASLSDAYLRNANLRDADLRNADLSNANLSYAYLRNAYLSNAYLSNADLSGADLSGANLSGANLSCAYLRDADFSNAKGLTSQIEYVKKHFATCESGIIVYKTFGEYRSPNTNWVIKSGSYICEVANGTRTNACGCGVNVGTKEWILRNTSGDIWECLIEWLDLAGVVVPYNTDGKIRAERVKLLRKVSREELEV